MVAKKKLLPHLQNLTQSQQGKLQSLRQDILVNSIEFIKEFKKGVAANIDVKLDYYVRQQTYI